MQLIRRNDIGQQIGRGASALTETSTSDVLKLLSSGNNVADLVLRPTVSNNGGLSVPTDGSGRPSISVNTGVQGNREVWKAKLDAAIKAKKDRENLIKQNANNKSGASNNAGTKAGESASKSTGRDGSSAEAAALGAAKSLGAKALAGTVAATVAGAPFGTAVGFGLKSLASPVGLATTIGNALSKGFTGYGVVDNLAAALQSLTSTDLESLTGGLLTPNPQGFFGDARTESTSFGNTGFTEGNSTTRGEMNGTIAAQSPTGTYTHGNPVLAGMTAEQVAQATMQQAKVTAALTAAMAAAASAKSAGANSSNSGPGGGASQTSASAMSNANNSSSPAQVGGHSGYGQGGRGGGMGYGGGNSTGNSGSSGTGRGGGNYGGGGHSGAGGIGA